MKNVKTSYKNKYIPNWTRFSFSGAHFTYFKKAEGLHIWHFMSASGFLFGKVESMEKEIKNIGVVGARTLPHNNETQVAEVTEDLLDRGFHIASGGAVGADAYCLSHLVHIGQADKGTVYSPWKNYSGFPAKVRVLTRQFKQYGGSIIWGNASGKEDYTVVRAALLGRNLKLLEALHGLVAFIYGESKGTLFTVNKAIKAHLPIVIFAIDRDLPEFPGVRWKPLLCGGCWENAYKAVYLK